MCFYKYKVSITTKFLMMKWKTGPCDRSKAYISDRIAANLASTPLIPQQKCSHTPFIYIYMQTYHPKPKQVLTSSDIKSLLSSPFSFANLVFFLRNTTRYPWPFVCQVLCMLSKFFDDQTHLERKCLHHL